MGELDFDMSSQARYWMFDEESLQQCREAACQGAPKVRKFACGYANRNKGKKNDTTGNNTAATTHTFLSPQEQEQLVSFHAKEIQSLVGPDAIFPALRISSSTLSTAISLLRRFFLSNSAADYHPRNIACAAAMLAAKSESSHRLQIDVLSRATWYIHAKAQTALQKELKAVSIPEIEVAERALLQGCDGYLRCHHPFGAVKVLASDISNFLISEPTQEFCLGEGSIQGSPKIVLCDHSAAISHHDLCERALSLAQWALVYSDVNFFFPPGQVAFAAVAVALDGHEHGDKLGGNMREYLEMRFRNKTLDELDEFESQVGRIIILLEKCSSIDLTKFSPNWQYCHDGSADEHQAAELHRVFCKVSHLRSTKDNNTFPASPPQTCFSPVQPMEYYLPHHFGYHYHDYHHYHHYHHRTYYPPQPQQFLPINEGSRKRGREEDQYQKYAQPSHAHYNKVARVTPVTMDP